MNNPVIKEERERPPDWATPEAGSAAAVTAQAVSGEPKITERQRSYLLDLIAKKAIPDEQEGKLDLIMKCLRISEDPEEYGMSKSKASELITWFIARPDKPRQAQSLGSDMDQRFAVGVPAGRYAVDGDDGYLKFYKVWVSPDNTRLNVYVEHGPDESGLKYQKQTLGVLRKIKTAGIRESAIRYGMEIGACSNCGRRLTNHISRELGIGPICGGRMFGEGDAWKEMVASTRQLLIEAGINPDENIEE